MLRRERPVAAARSAARGPRDDRRHRRDQRQRTAAAPLRHAARSHHRHRDRAGRRPPRQGRRPRRQERRRLRSVEAAVRIVRQPRRDHERDVQAVAAAARIADAGRRRVADAAERRGACQLALAGSPLDAVDGRARSRRPHRLLVRFETTRARPPSGRLPAAAGLCATHGGSTDVLDGDRRRPRPGARTSGGLEGDGGTVVKLATLADGRGRHAVACRDAGGASAASSCTAAGRAALGVVFVRLDGDRRQARRDRRRTAPRATGPRRQRRAAGGAAGPRSAGRRRGDQTATPCRSCARSRRASIRSGTLNPGREPWESGSHERRRTARVCVRHALAARAADRQVRPLRLLPADLPELPAARSGDGFAARPHLPDAGGRRRPHGRSSAGVRRALRHLPRLHGVRDRVPVGRAVRAAHRGDARGDRAAPRAARRRAPVPAPALRAAALSRAAAAAARCRWLFGEPAARLAGAAGPAAAAAAQPRRRSRRDVMACLRRVPERTPAAGQRRDCASAC